VYNAVEKTYTYYLRDAQGNTLALYEQDELNPSSITFTWKEQHLYGSSRLGIMDIDVVLDGSVENNRSVFSADNSPLTPGTLYEGWKRYELTNHLGNVLTAINDRKTEVDANSDGTADYYEPTILFASDYYPFGMEMPGRQYSAASYRYGFNGKEKDESGEFSALTHYDYGFRIYNPALGRFLSVDPLMRSYPMLTPYQFASNRPIWGIDLDGLEIKYVHYEKDGSRTVINVQDYVTIETTSSGLDNFHGVSYLSQNTFGEIEVNWDTHIAQVEAERQRYFEQQSKSRRAEADLARYKTKMNNPFTYAPMIAEELAEVPMLIAYGAEGLITNDYTNFKYQSLGILIPGVSKSTIKALGKGLDFTSPTYAKDALSELNKSIGNLNVIKQGNEAHHVVPSSSVKSNAVIQSSVIGGFDLNNFHVNGELLEFDLHRGERIFDHPDYRAYVDLFTTRFQGNFIDTHATRNFVEGELVPELRSLINEARHTNRTIDSVARDRIKNFE